MYIFGDRIEVGLENCGNLPWLVEVNRNKEYAAAKNLHSPRGIIYNLDAHRELKIIEISPSRLIEGGAAILMAERIIHQNEMAGNKERIPLVKNKLRV